MIHVIVMTYNHEEFITQCINGILSQKTPQRLQITIIDDASSDRTWDVVQNLIKTSSIPIESLRSDRNYRGSLKHPVFEVMNNSVADFFAFCDGDDFWIDEFKLEKQFKLANTKPNIGLVHTDYSLLENNSTGNNTKVRSLSQISKAMKVHTAFDLIQGNEIKHSTVLMRREFLELRFLDGSEGIIPKDWLMYVNVLSKSKAAYINEISTVHRVHKGGFWNGSVTREHRAMKEQVRWFCASQLGDGDLRNAFREKVARDTLRLRITQSAIYRVVKPLVQSVRSVRRSS